MKDVDMNGGDEQPATAAPGKADLAARLAAVFGGLGGGDSWSISQQVRCDHRNNLLDINTPRYLTVVSWLAYLFWYSTRSGYWCWACVHLL